MAKIQNPTLFSRYFGIPATLLDDAGLIDPFVDVDTQLFIDPVLLEKSSNILMSGDAITAFRSHFENFVRLITISEKEGDVAWRTAERLLDLREPPENGLGYGGSGRSGSSRPNEVRDSIMRTAKEIVNLGSKDPEMISLMGFFEENVGPDTISDFTTRVIIEQLAQLTEDFCSANDIELHKNAVLPDRRLPRVLDKNGKEKFVVLVPTDVVRELPIANDWGDIEAAVSHNAKIRQAVNSMLAGIAQPTVTDRKDALRAIALQSPQNFEEFLAAVKEHVRTYDPNVDALAYYKMKAIFGSGFDGLKSDARYDLKKGPDEIARLVHDTINFFKHHVENGNLWEELWIGDKPKKERAPQLIYYAIADAYCSAHDVDISPEANMGGGPIDFKFSNGYRARVLVEMKRSSGTVRHGYDKQLEIYLDASRSQHGIFVVMDYGDLGQKLDQILKIQEYRRVTGQRASDIVVIDATKKQSASKRK
ncbi:MULTISPECIES: hypothetical protein [unclassified Sphingopyxis]|uniref:hypothetical protein n=1 Tax=unclassified Sphingopyxis TaxID=2614943 RepID=UPI0025FAF3BF|nr:MULTISPECIES: hypothetical protein [unclassified Sphingopyxis]